MYRVLALFLILRVWQEMLFRMAGLPMVENCLSGYNSCMFAYGQVIHGVKAVFNTKYCDHVVVGDT